MLRGGNPLTVGVGIIIEVIRKNNSDYDPDVSAGADALPSSRDPIYLGTLLRIFAKHVPDFMALILSPTYTVINEDGTTTTKKRELKAAFGEVIEPLGFDRFKTCELMAELLHCSNMGLLNERGSEKFVKERDEERERLKAEGNLPVSRDGPSMNDLGDDGPLYANGQSQSRDGSDSPEDIRKLEVQNAGEDDGFEDVTVSGDLNDEVKDDFDEKPDHESEAQDPTKHFALQSDLDNEDDFVDEALSAPPIEPGSVEKAIGDGIAALPGDAPAVIQPLSPTKSDLTANVEALNVDKERPFDAVQSSTTPASSKSHLHAELPPTTGTLSPSTLSPHPEDQPAPLFANRNDQSSSPAKDEDATPEVEQEGTGEGSQGTLDTTLPEGMESELMSGNDLGFESQTETDLDGSPVVGDFLKLMFVEHKVVPTILVSLLISQNSPRLMLEGFLLSIPLEQLPT
jgi:SIT4-associating protein SAP185/190